MELRIARHSEPLDAVVAFYRDGLGLTESPPTLAIAHNAAALASLLSFVLCDRQAIVRV